MCDIYGTHRWDDPYHPLDRVCLRCGIKKYQAPLVETLYREGEGRLGRLALIKQEKEVDEHWKSASLAFKYGYLKRRFYNRLIILKYKCQKYFF